MAYPSFHKEIEVGFLFFALITVLAETSLGIALSQVSLW